MARILRNLRCCLTGTGVGNQICFLGIERTDRLEKVDLVLQNLVSAGGIASRGRKGIHPGELADDASDANAENADRDDALNQSKSAPVAIETFMIVMELHAPKLEQQMCQNAHPIIRW